MSEDTQDEGNRSKGEEECVHSINEDSSIEVVEEEYVEEEYTEGEEYSDVEYIEEVIEEVIEEEESVDEVLDKKEMTSKKSEEGKEVSMSGVIQSNSCERKRKTGVELINSHTQNKVQKMPPKTKSELDSKERKVSDSCMKKKSRWDSQSKDHSSIGGNENKPNKKKSRWDRVEDQEKITSTASLGDYDDFLKLKQQLIEIDLKLHRLEGSQGNEAKNIRVKLQKQRAEIATNLFVDKNHQILIQNEKILSRKLQKKIYVPTKEYPEFNFIGLILGPRGNNLKRMERETKTRIFLRGQGSVLGVKNAENKKKNAVPSDCDNDDLHVVIEAHDQKSLDAGSEMVEKLLVPPEESSQLKMSQLRELAMLNGMERSDSCQVCGDTEHFTSFCPLTDKCSNFLSDVSGGGFPISSNSNIFSEIKSAAGTLSSSTIDPSNVYVGYLPQSVDDAGLNQLFRPFGAITSARIVKDHITGLSKSYGFVKYRNPTNAAKAVEKMNGMSIEGKTIAVRIAHHSPIPSVISQGAYSSRPIPEPIPGAVGLFGPPPSGPPITPGSNGSLSQNENNFTRPGYSISHGFPCNFPASSRGSLRSYLPQTSDIFTSASSTAPTASELANFSGNPANFNSNFLLNNSYSQRNLFSSEKSQRLLLDPKFSNLSNSRDHRTLTYHSPQVSQSLVVPTSEETTNFPGNPDYVRTKLFR